MRGLDLQISSLEWGKFSPSTQTQTHWTSLFPAQPLCGHLKDISYGNSDPIQLLRESPDIAKYFVTENVTMEEQPFDSYNVYFHRHESFKSVNVTGLEIKSVRLTLASTQSADAIFLDMVGENSIAFGLRHGRIYIESSARIGKTFRRKTDSVYQKVSASLHHQWLPLTISIGVKSVTLRLVTSSDEIELISSTPINDHGFENIHLGGSSERRFSEIEINKGYRGCIGNVYVNRDYVDLHKAPTHQTKSNDDVINYCPACVFWAGIVQKKLCKHGGKCLSFDSENYKCDCRGTGYGGKDCGTRITKTPTIKVVTTDMIISTSNTSHNIASSTTTRIASPLSFPWSNTQASTARTTTEHPKDATPITRKSTAKIGSTVSAPATINKSNANQITKERTDDPSTLIPASIQTMPKFSSPAVSTASPVSTDHDKQGISTETHFTHASSSHNTTMDRTLAPTDEETSDTTTLIASVVVSMVVSLFLVIAIILALINRRNHMDHYRLN